MKPWNRIESLSAYGPHSYWSQRIMGELKFASAMSSVMDNKYEKEIVKTIESLEADIAENGVITKSAALKAENLLSPLSADAKKYRILCVSHAHIDMNWMWGMHETVAVTIDTFRTMLDLMKEYPKFTFSQSQASVYRLVEEHDPDMLEEIKQRVKEGRWEVSASTWVETDKNMPNGESLSRHILYTKKYLSRILDIPADSLQLDFEPDTFGHNRSVPEILSKGGVKYYYHCRGYEGENIYTWKSPSGAEILVYKEPEWYNADIHAEMLTRVPLFCNQYGIDTMMKVYGVGDHGGGPTRRDIERIIDMSSWPIMPSIEFGTYHQFYEILSKHASSFPVIEKELNFVFTGCYTSQSRIKMSNRISEDRLYESETLSSIAHMLGGRKESESFAKAWENVLFNHFHDILPGSGTVETREYAMGQFQKTLAYANTNASKAMNLIASQIDTSAIVVADDKLSLSEGAGVGYDLSHMNYHHFPQSERGKGNTRIFHLFNTTQYHYNGVADISLWDWNGDMNALYIEDHHKNKVQAVIDFQETPYWGHSVHKVSLIADIPAFGYSTYVLYARPDSELPRFAGDDGREDHIADNNLIMENNKIKAVFDRRTMGLISLSKKDGTGEVIDPDNPGGLFRYIQEDNVNGMTAWRVGNYMNVECINHTNNVRVTAINHTAIRQSISYEIKFHASVLQVEIILSANSAVLDFKTAVDWQEKYIPSLGSPQLNFYIPVNYQVPKYRYDTAFGTIDRDPLHHDVPAISFAAALPEKKNPSLMVITDSKYGFRGADNALAVSLIRSSGDPDPYPEYGMHHMKLGIGYVEKLNNHDLHSLSSSFIHPVSVISGKVHSGESAQYKSFFHISEGTKVSAVKSPEDPKMENSMIIRIFDITGKDNRAHLTINHPFTHASIVDINENIMNKPIQISENVVSLDLKPYSVETIRVDF